MVKYLGLIALTIFSVYVGAFDNQFRVNQLAAEKGLSQLTVNSVVRDAYGFIWVGTDDGLNRFDGYAVKHYKLNKKGISSLGSKVKSIDLNINGDLLVVTEKGVFKYNQGTDSFNIIFKVPAEEEAFNDAKSDSMGQLWLGTTKGNILVIKDRELKFSYDLSFEIDNQKVSPFINDINFSNNRIWVSTSHGLWEKSPNDIHFKLIKNNFSYNRIFGSLPVENTEGIRNKLYIATQRGLYQYDFDTEQSILIPIHSSKKNNDIRVKKVVKSNNDILWLATYQGLYEYNTSTGHLKVIKLHQEQEKQPVIISIFQDKENTIWVGTQFSGLFYFSLNEREFGHYMSSGLNVDCLSGNLIYALSAADSKLWVAVWGSGVQLIDFQTNQCTRIRPTGNEKVDQLLKTTVSIEKGVDGDWWFGGSGSGLVRYNFRDNAFKYFNNDYSNPESSVFPDVFALKLDKQKQLWIGTQFGLAKYDYKTDKITHYRTKDDDGLFNNQIYSLAIDNEKNVLWIGTEKGIDKLDLKSEEFVRDRYFSNSLKSISTSVYALNVGSKGEVWAGGALSGLYKIENNTVVQHFTESDGLPNNTVYSIEMPNSETVFGSTNNGLFKLEISSNSISLYPKEFGLQGSEFSTASDIDLKNNILYVAGSNGFNRIKLSKISNRLPSSYPVITDLFINNKSVNTSESVRFTEGVAIHSAKNIALNHEDKFVGFEFSALNYTAANKIKYRYKLKGFDEQWIVSSSSNRVASFTSLPHGEYDLLINASDIAGYWTNNVSKVKLIVHPPLWLTWWAKLFYVTLLVLTPLWITFYRSKAIRKRAAELEVTVNLRTQELIVQKDIVEKLLNQKNNEFINISHEFRTPLTLILGPVKRLFEQSTPEQQLSLNLIQSNAERLLKLVDELLEIERLKVNKALPKQVCYLEGIIEDIVHAYEYASQAADLVFRSYIQEGLCVNVLHDSIEKILSNLLSNAIKYNVKGGEIELIIRAKGNMLSITVLDSGIGMPKEVQKRIFDKFNRGDEQQLHAHGSGVGLSVVQEIVHAHGGTIKVESHKNKGTRFELEIPCVIENATVNETLVTSEEPAVVDGKRVCNESEVTSLFNGAEVLEDDKPVVLLIEDDTDMRRYAHQVISERFQCVVTENGEQGIKVAEELIPDIVVCDVMMPGISGHQVCKELKSKETTSHIPILMLTARVDKESRLQSYELLADEYLTKPFDDDELVIRLESLLSIRQKLREEFSRQTSSSEGLNVTAINKIAPSDEINDIDKRFLQRVNNCIGELYSEQSLNTSQLAEQLGFSSRQLQRKLKSLTDQSPAELIKQHRLTRAKEQLEQGEAIKVVAFNCGFSTTAYFSSSFKNYFGLTPKQVQQSTCS